MKLFSGEVYGQRPQLQPSMEQNVY